MGARTAMSSTNTYSWAPRHRSLVSRSSMSWYKRNSVGERGHPSFIPLVGRMGRSLPWRVSTAGVCWYISPSIRMMFSVAPASLTIPVSMGRGIDGNALATSSRATYLSCVCKSFNSFVAKVVMFWPCVAPCSMSSSPGVMALDIRVRRRRVSMLYMAVDT